MLPDYLTSNESYDSDMDEERYPEQPSDGNESTGLSSMMPALLCDYQITFLSTSSSISVAFCWFLSHRNQIMLKGAHLSGDREAEVPSTSRAKAGRRAPNSAELTSRKAISLPSSILKPSECKLRFSLVLIWPILTYKVSGSTGLSGTPFDFN